MAFKLISRHDPAPMAFDTTAGESFVYGECVKFSGGKIAKAGTTDDVAGVVLHAVTGVSGVVGTCKQVVLVDAEQIWEADYTGTPAAGFVVGVNSATLDTTGANLDASNVTNGPCSVIKINTNDKKAWVKFKKRQLA